MSYKCCVVLMCIQVLFWFNLSQAATENESYKRVYTFVRVSTAEAENPELLIKRIKKNLLAILAKEKILQAGYPKPCVLKVQADKSQICVEDSTVSLEASARWLPREEGWSLSLVTVKSPIARYFDKQIYLLPDGFIATLQFTLDGLKGSRDDIYSRVVVNGIPSKRFDNALDRAIIEAGAVVDE